MIRWRLAPVSLADNIPFTGASGFDRRITTDAELFFTSHGGSDDWSIDSTIKGGWGIWLEAAAGQTQYVTGISVENNAPTVGVYAPLPVPQIVLDSIKRRHGGLFAIHVGPTPNGSLPRNNIFNRRNRAIDELLGPLSDAGVQFLSMDTMGALSQDPVTDGLRLLQRWVDRWGGQGVVEPNTIKTPAVHRTYQGQFWAVSGYNRFAELVAVDPAWIGPAKPTRSYLFQYAIKGQIAYANLGFPLATRVAMLTDGRFDPIIDTTGLTAGQIGYDQRGALWTP